VKKITRGIEEFREFKGKSRPPRISDSLEALGGKKGLSKRHFGKAPAEFTEEKGEIFLQ